MPLTSGYAVDQALMCPSAAEVRSVVPLQCSRFSSSRPPAKNEAKSLLADGHPHANRVIALLEAAQQATLDRPGVVLFGSRPIGIDLMASSPSQPPADATSFLGGVVGDVLEARSRPGLVEHLGNLAKVGLYDNDRQIREVAYRWQHSSSVCYIVKVWELSD
ncbi:MAG: hypothetical protein ACYC1E_03350 [Propionibacteriaceae bacterium]